jgi:hypothetical protein
MDTAFLKNASLSSKGPTMTYSKLSSVVAILAITAMLLTVPVAALADSFKILDLGIAESNVVYRIDTAGDVVIFGADFCGGITPSCFKTYVNGLLSSVSGTTPSLAYDDGTACRPSLPPGFSPFKAVCNGGRVAFGNEFPPTVFAGPNPFVELQRGSADTIMMNASGDVAWTDGIHEENFEAIDLTSDATNVPEPNTLVLLTTGVFGAVGALRRRLVGR